LVNTINLFKQKFINFEKNASELNSILGKNVIEKKRMKEEKAKKKAEEDKKKGIKPTEKKTKYTEESTIKLSR